MKIATIVASGDNQVHAFVEKRKASLVPRERRGHHKIDVISHDLSKESDFTERVLSLQEGYDVVSLVLIDGLHADLGRAAQALFVGHLRLPSDNQYWGNIFSSFFSRWLGNLEFMAKYFKNEKERKIVLLPRNHFVASDLAALFGAVYHDTDQGTWKRSIELAISRIADRQMPKKSTSSPRRYIVDDEGKHFEISLEHHAEAETGPPHDLVCSLTKTFRFGFRIDSKTHYNVSSQRDSQRLSGKFLNCHLSEMRYRDVTHLNVFPNNFAENCYDESKKGAA